MLSEARTAGRLNSPNVVAVHDVISDNGVTYIVMELVEAPTPADLVARRTFTDDELAGIVHRDVKPSNIMIAPDGRTAR